MSIIGQFVQLLNLEYIEPYLEESVLDLVSSWILSEGSF